VSFTGPNAAIFEALYIEEQVERRPISIHDALAPILIDLEEQARLDGLLDGEERRVRSDFPDYFH